MTARGAVAAYGERVATRHLITEGMQILDRNWRCRHGEIDIVARDADDLVFCEVKTRRTSTFGTPAEAVIAAKARRLRRLAAAWLAANDVHAPGIRFDVIGVVPRQAGAAAVEHLRGAF
ncbi:MAG: YraN family protein [Micromonosporaceae bacterium]